MVPFFLVFMYAFIVLIRIFVVQAAIQTAAANSVQQVASAIAPFERQLQEGGDKLSDLRLSATSVLPDEIAEWLEQGDAWRTWPQVTADKLLGNGLEPLVWTHIPERVKSGTLSEGRLTVKHVQMPYWTTEEPVFGLELTYRMDVAIPFYRKQIMLRADAQERVWFGQ